MVRINRNSIKMIAEMACAHNGSVREAKKIIRNAKYGNANFIQLQIWQIDHMMSDNNPLYKKIKKLELPISKWKDICEYADIYKLKKSVCVYEHKSIDIIESFNPSFYKINSSDLSNPLVLNEIALTNRDINLSVGASTIKEIDFAVNYLTSKSRGKITLMYGFQSFPTNFIDLNLNKITSLFKTFNLSVGFQDHSSGKSIYPFLINSMALGLGIKTFEQHIRSSIKMKGTDQESSLYKIDFLKLTNYLNDLHSALGQEKINKFNFKEMKYRKFQKKTLVYSDSFKKNKVITRKDISILRLNSEGLSPINYKKILGKITKKNVYKHNKIKPSDLI